MPALNALSKALHWWSDGVTECDLKEQGLDVSDPHLMACVKLARELHALNRLSLKIAALPQPVAEPHAEVGLRLPRVRGRVELLAIE